MYLVAGLGATGQSVLRYLQFQKSACLAFDTRASLDCAKWQAQFPQVRFACGQLPDAWLTQFETVVLSPGIALSSDWVQDLIAMGKEVIGDIELFARAVSVPVIGVTGSNGKSTVTTMVGQILQETGLHVGVGGNIGRPALDLLLEERPYEVMVLELSSFQLETTYSLQTVASSVLNISEDHMDRYRTLAAYVQAKTRLLDWTHCAVLPNDFELYGVSQPETVRRFGWVKAPVLPPDQYGLLGQDEGSVFLGEGEHPLVPLNGLADQSKHFLLNALAAMALTADFGISSEIYTKVLSIFKGLPHRTEKVVEKEGVLWINDSKGTNVGATLMALESFLPQATVRQGRLFLIAGGEGKSADFTPLQTVVSHCHRVILLGADAPRMAKVLAPVVKVEQVDTLQQAVLRVANQVAPNDIVLFSPACASFDQFSHYVERGDTFRGLVKALYRG